MPDGPAAASSTQTLTDIRPSVVNPTVAPAARGLKIPVITGSAPSATAEVTATNPQPTPSKPATSFHAQPQAGAVLDLRPASAAEATAATAAPAQPAAKIAVADQAAVVKKSGVSGRLSRAAAVEKSQMIKRFPSSSASGVAAATAQSSVPAAPNPTPAPVATVASPPAPPPPKPLPAPMPDVKVTTPIPALPPLPAPASALPIAPAPQPTPAAAAATAMPMPNSVATQLAAIKPLDTPESRQQVRQDALKKAMVKTGPSPAAVAVAAVMIAVMGGYVWLTNYPHMAARLASTKAGIEASLPGYMPSSYRLKGPISYSPGQVKFKFSSAGSSSPLVITAKQTHWDSASLLENYVSKQSSDYLTMHSQGLTIYFYNGNHATWINQGLWYSLEGDSHLNREQLLKIIDSL